MSQALPASVQRNIFLFHLLTFFDSFLFILSNWLYFWTKYMTYGQIGIVDGVAFGFSLILDIPTGAVADLFGKKKTIVFAFFCCSVGTLIIASAHSLTQIFVGWMIAQVGFAFSSGVTEALAYDTLLEYHQEAQYEKVISTNRMIFLITSAVTTFLGGFLYVIHERIPGYLWAFGFVLAFMASFFLVEPKVKKIKFSVTNYFRQFSTGIEQLIQPALLQYFLFFFILLGVYYLYSWGILRPALATSFGFNVQAQGALYAIFMIISAIIVGFVPKIRRKFSDFKGLILLTLLICSGFLLAAFPLGQIGVIALLLIGIGGETAYPWISTIINDEIPSQYRATTLSTVSFLSKIPYVAFAVLVGNALQNGLLTQFSFGVGIVLLAGIAFSLVTHLITKPKASHI